MRHPEPPAPPDGCRVAGSPVRGNSGGREEEVGIWDPSPTRAAPYPPRQLP
ncbi:hypothetical protein STTU_3453 [Streptomyces sp. Tu6071]|nr:hypothetical protein STTU_3453 [Streptomyces sp. Tu6071]